MVTRRWCLACFEDFAEDTSAVGLCMACDMEHERAVVLSGMAFGVHNPDVAEWWGPMLDTINPEDIEFGFYETTIGIELEEV